ncbi:MAG: hypothetical protein KGJ78_14070 [Alphaproteobacteria bacterium]|nr:hypothetical protein [Alphaproteobacteria bacterium]
MMRWTIVAALGALAALATPVAAQESAETVVVTGARAGEFDAATTPHLYLLRRADHVITKVRVVCDTRDPAKRRAELKDTLRSMIREAQKSGTISLGVGDEIITDLTEKMLDKVVLPDAGKVDTSVAFVVIKTRISKDDLFDDATGRIEHFIEATPKAGRTEILRENRWDLTIVGPEQYRGELIARIAADSKQTAALFGPDYVARVEGLQRAVAWYQKGPLELALYIPYTMTVAPKKD